MVRKSDGDLGYLIWGHPADYSLVMRARLRDMRPVAITRRRYDIIVVKKSTSVVEVDEDVVAIGRFRGCGKGSRQRERRIKHEEFVPLPSAVP
jgi:hypothetical protein